MLIIRALKTTANLGVLKINHGNKPVECLKYDV